MRLLKIRYVHVQRIIGDFFREPCYGEKITIAAIPTIRGDRDSRITLIISEIKSHGKEFVQKRRDLKRIETI